MSKTVEVNGVNGALLGVDLIDLSNACRLIKNHKLDVNKVYVKGGYPVIYIDRKPCRVHRILGEFYFGDLDGYHVHHMDENKLNNSKENLMKVTPSEHMALYHNDIHKHRSQQGIHKAVMAAGNARVRKDVTFEEVAYLREKGLTYTQISDLLDCGYNTVWRRINSKPESLDWSDEE